MMMDNIIAQDGTYTSQNRLVTIISKIVADVLHS